MYNKIWENTPKKDMKTYSFDVSHDHGIVSVNNFLHNI